MSTVTNEEIINVVADLFHMDPLTISADHDLYDDLSFDSLDMLELIMACEEHFKVEIPDAAVDEVRTINALSKVIRRCAQ